MNITSSLFKKAGNRIFIALILFLFPAVCGAQTLAQLRTEVRRNLKDNNSGRYRYPDSEILDYLNEAQREIVNATWLTKNVTSYQLIPNTSYYALPSDFLAVYQVYYTNPQRQTTTVDEDSQKGLYDKNPDWKRQSSGGTPVEYMVSDSTPTGDGSDAVRQISYYPVPLASSTGTITIWYYCSVPDLVNDSDVPFLNNKELYQFHMALVYHASARIKLIEAKTSDSTSYFTLYSNYIATIKDRLGRSPNYNPGMQAGSGYGK